jgi:hypothetical protein
VQSSFSATQVGQWRRHIQIFVWRRMKGFG